MKVTETQFNVLNSIYCSGDMESIQNVNLSRSTVSSKDYNVCCKELIQAGLLEEDMHLTSDGIQYISSHRVKNAIIMAAGMGSRLAPFTYEKPKCLMVIKGEVLIERQIRQLQEAGITDITVVVGYMKEKMYYLEKKMGVNIVVNEDYYRYNNTSSLLCVADKLDNTYICSSDNYFCENVFAPYVYRQYYAAVYEPGKTEEYCLTCDLDGRITQVNIGGNASWFMFGHVYFSKEFSRKFVDILKMEYKFPITRKQLWEDMYIRHIDDLDLYIKTYDRDIIQEFDSLEDVKKFDPAYRYVNTELLERN